MKKKDVGKKGERTEYESGGEARKTWESGSADGAVYDR